MIFLLPIFFIIIILFLRLVGTPVGTLLGTRKSVLSEIEKKRIWNQWEQIKELSQLPGTSHSNQAIIKADSLLDQVLKSRKVRGESLGERLKNAEKLFSKYSDYDQTWKAHKIRNTVVHETSFDLNKALMEKTLKQYEQGMKELLK